MGKYQNTPTDASQPAPSSNNGTAPDQPLIENPSVIPVIDMAKFSLSQDFSAPIGVEKILTKINVGKPHRQQFVRVHPGAEYQALVSLLEVAEDREFYLLSEEAVAACPSEAFPAKLHLGITRRGDLFIWPIRLPRADVRMNEWHQSQSDAAQRAMLYWVSVRSNLDAHGYDVFRAMVSISEPKWPDKPFNELLYIAFRGRIIESPDHDVLLKLNGQK